MISFSVRYASHTDKGIVRDHNEDNLIVGSDIGLAAVADGMGGHNSGELASALAVKTLAEKLKIFMSGKETPRQYDPSYTPSANMLLAAAEDANNAIFDAASANPEHNGMGTTLSALLLDGDKAVVAHVGDSRVYLIRDGKANQITDDHSLVMEQARRGILTMEEAENSRMQNILTRAMGLSRDTQMDLYEVTLKEGDRLLLCTDGLFKAVNNASFSEILAANPDPEQACKKLVDTANANGGPDNITTVAVDIGRRTAPAQDEAGNGDGTHKKTGLFSKLLALLGAGSGA